MVNETNYTQKVAEYVSKLRYENLPPEVVQQTKKVILDALSCQVACSSLDNGRTIVKVGATLGGNPEATPFGGNYHTSAVHAALVNGTLGHGDEIDESLEEIGHASAVMIPVAFALGEKEKRSGKEVIAAVVAGYDVAGREVNAGLASATLTRGVSSATLSVLPGAAVAASLLRLDVPKTRITFGLAAAAAGGFYNLQSEAHHGAKSCMRGYVARDAVTAALMAQAGYDGPQSIFEGPINIVTTFTGGTPKLDELIKDLGKHFIIMDTCIKLFSAGHPIHSAADALLRIMAREKIGGADIKSILIRQPHDEQRTVDNRDMPEITIQYCLAVLAYDKQLTWDQYQPNRLNAPEVLDLKKRIKSIHDPKLDERKKITKAHSSEVEVETKDGRHFAERGDYPPGDPGNPATEEQIENKALQYAPKVIGEKKTKELIAMVKKLEDVPDINQVGALLRV